MQSKSGPPRANFRRYLLALLTPAAVAATMQVSWPFFEQTPVTPFLLAVMLCAWYGGLGAGLLSLFVSLLLSDYFFIQPYFSLWPPRPGDLAYLVTLASVGTFVSVVSELLLRSSRRAESSLQSTRRAEETLRRSQEQLAGVIGSAMDAIISVDADQRIVLFNAAAEKMFGYPSEAVIGQPLDRFIPERFRSTHREHIENFGRSHVTRRTVGALDGIYGLRADGEEFPVEASISELGSAGQKIYTVILRDITERKQGVEALDAERKLLRTLIDLLPDYIYLKDTQTRFLTANKACAQLMGAATPAELLGKTDADFYSVAAAARFRSDEQTVLAGVPLVDHEEPYVRKDGTRELIVTTKLPIRDSGGKVTGLIGYGRNVTAVEKTEEALRESEERYRTLFKCAPDGIVIADAQSNYIDANSSICRMLGYTRDELIGLHASDIVAATEIPQIGIALGVIEEQSEYHREWQFRRQDGSLFPAEVIATKMPDGNLLGMIRDITERKLGEAALRESEERYRLLFASNPLPMWVFDLETLRFLEVNDAAVRHYQYSREEFMAMTINDIRPPEDVPALLAQVAKVGDSEPGLWLHRKKDGQVIAVEITSHELTFAGRRAELVLADDVTKKQQAEEAVKQAEENYRSIFENAIEGIFQATPEGRFISVNPSMANILGYESPAELIAHRSAIDTEHYVDENTRAELERLLAEDSVVVGYECEVYRKDRSKIWTMENLRAIRDESGAILNYEGSIENITERKTLAEQLRQSQKLEAIGLLAGGIAHDFNNLLTVISGYSDLSLRRTREDNPLHRNISEIKKAAERAAGLTRQLLAFSRKQVMQPKVLDLNAVVFELEKMLHRLIGEDVGLHTVLQPNLGNVNADPGQIEQIIMNLAVNARDAMPKGGKLTIETENVFLDEDYAKHHIAVTPGPYVMLAITDTGGGMDQQTQARIFEPFYTTKEAGKGTGLGLSTVYGIVKQSGGNVWVYSEVGFGTVFKVYLPRVDKRVQEYDRNGESDGVIRGTETVLLAEDEEAVRKLARQVLEMNGYRVLEAANGGAALQLCERHKEPIQLLITDVIMPEMGGRELADRLARLRPETKVLFMSGYTDNAIVHQGALLAGANFIQKPFPTDALVRKVRQVLDTPKEIRLTRG